MNEKLTYLDCWTQAATALFAQALVGEPVLEESLPKPLTGAAEGFVATLRGDHSGRFSVILDAGIFDLPLLGEGMDQRAGWRELLSEVANSAVGDMLAKSGVKLQIESFEPTGGESKISRAFQLKCGEHAWMVLVRDDVREPKVVAAPVEVPIPAHVSASPLAGAQSINEGKPGPTGGASARPGRANPTFDGSSSSAAALSPGIDLLLDVELEASLRFGSREMPLGEILDLGPGDVVQLDRHIADPVDLIIGDKIVARGEVVLINGNFGLRVTEVAEPRRRLESIRCLF